MLRIDASALDYVIIGLYFVTVLGIGFLARRLIKSDLDFFLSGRSLPAWITGLAFISANLGALEILGMAANGAQYGVATVHFYWIGAIPAVLFLGVVMMPFGPGVAAPALQQADPPLQRDLLRRGDRPDRRRQPVSTTRCCSSSVFGLGFVLSFGYWTTNLAEVQRALSAKNLNAAQRTPLIGAFPKIFIPLIVVIPGLVALVTVPGFGTGSNPGHEYNNAIPALIAEYLPTGMLGLAITALLAAFMAGVAANVSAFNTVVTYDLYQDYIRGDASPRHYITFGRIATVVGVLISIATAFIAKGYENIMNYVQLLFSYFNAPLFATFIIGMFWKRATPWGGFAGIVAGTFGAFMTHQLTSSDTIDSARISPSGGAGRRCSPR